VTASSIPVGDTGRSLNTEVVLTDAGVVHNEIVELAPGPMFDAFSRLRISAPVTLFDSQSQYDDSTKDHFFHKVTTGGSTSHDHDQSCVRLTTDTTAGASVIRQTQRYMSYQPGKSQLIFITADFEAVDGGTKEVMYGDDNNGIGYRMAADGSLSVFKRSKRTGSVVETEVFQADWSEDVFDGTGITEDKTPNPSSITLDGTKSFIFVIDLQWLATGQVRVGFDIDGALYMAHHFKWANANNGVYMSTANLPVRYEITGNASASTFTAICCSVMSEGGFVADLGHGHATPSGITPVACGNGVETPVVSIRPKALFNTYVNRGSYIPTAISFYTTTNPILLRMYHGGTLTGATFNSTDAESGVEFDVAATAITGGHLATSEYGAAAGGGKAFSTASGAETLSRLFLTLDIDGNNIDNGNYTIVGVGLGGTANVYCNIHWTEIK
jgi:hypothetical protein